MRRVAKFGRMSLALCLLAMAGAADEKPSYQTEVLTGRVVFLAEAIEREFGIVSAPEAKERILALRTKDGTFVPLVEDTRGRAFRADKRLREMDLELTVRRRNGLPAVQVMRVCELAQGEKREIDYWCAVCSIVMYELKECECCQGQIELRRTKVEK